MPLHLLGKKSWNVYNSENIARVQRDEAEARANEEAEERRMQEADAEHRLNLLRGREDSKIDQPASQTSNTSFPSDRLHSRKKRRLYGEDDTDRDIRLANEEVAAVSQDLKGVSRTSTAPLVDHRGHINLFPENHKRHSNKNEEAEAETANKRRENEDQYTMKFSNAAGNRPGSDRPWYVDSQNNDTNAKQVVGKDVWGNEDPGRQAREQQRIDISDPLAAMKKGVKQLRETERHRKEWMAQRERDLYEVEGLARKHQRKRESSEDSLETFSLEDGHRTSTKDPHHRHREHRRRHHSDRHRDRSKTRQHSRRRSRSPRKAGTTH